MFEPSPMDFRILELLPEEGLIGGVHWRGRFALDIANDIMESIPNEDKQYVTINGLTVGNALTHLEKEGLTKQYPGRGSKGGKRIWARTSSGTEFLSRKDEFLHAN